MFSELYPFQHLSEPEKMGPVSRMGEHTQELLRVIVFLSKKIPSHPFRHRLPADLTRLESTVD